MKITSLTAPSGNGGVMARVSSPGTGPDAYVGYFAGVDGEHVPAVARPGQRHHLDTAREHDGAGRHRAERVVPRHAAGDRVHDQCATAQSTASWDQAVVSVTDAGCPSTGSAGIRGMIAATDYKEFAVTKG